MKTLYFDCAMGASGDMLLGALLELSSDRDAALARLNALGIPGVTYAALPAEKRGVRGTHMDVRVYGGSEEEPGRDFSHRHARPGDLTALLDRLPLPESVRADAKAVYDRLAEAEAEAHGVPVELIHFHEVGQLDAAADIAGVCLLLRTLAPERVLASPVRLGGGTVRCAHGVLPVPTPATAALLRGVPTVAGGADGELCTPTGAALLRHFVSAFGPKPPMTGAREGVGCGTKDFAAPNCLRAVLGETE